LSPAAQFRHEPAKGRIPHFHTDLIKINYLAAGRKILNDAPSSSEGTQYRPPADRGHRAGPARSAGCHRIPFQTGNRNMQYEAWQGLGRIQHATGHLADLDPDTPTK